MKLSRPTIIEWKLLPGYPYEVSNCGQIRRSEGGPGAQVGRLLSPGHPLSGYVTYCGSKDGKYFWLTANRAVALAFLGPPPTPQHEAAHNDGNKSNNWVGNIRWATPKENTADSIRHGTKYIFPPFIRRILTKVQVKKICELKVKGVSYVELGKRFKVHPVTCKKIVTGVWRGVPL